jgi:hypothetical protein
VSPNVAWNGSLESYHPYLPPQKVSKIPIIECIYSRLPKNTKNHCGCLGLLGVKVEMTIPSSNLFPHPTGTSIVSIMNTQN